MFILEWSETYIPGGFVISTHTHTHTYIAMNFIFSERTLLSFYIFFYIEWVDTLLFFSLKLIFNRLENDSLIKENVPLNQNETCIPFLVWESTFKSGVLYYEATRNHYSKAKFNYPIYLYVITLMDDEMLLTLECIDWNLVMKMLKMRILVWIMESWQCRNSKFQAAFSLLLSCTRFGRIKINIPFIFMNIFAELDILVYEFVFVFLFNPAKVCED